MKTKIKELFLLAISAFVVFTSYAQPGTFDSSFGLNGEINLNIGVTPEVTAIQDDGKIVIGSVAPNSSSGFRTFALIRLLSDGQIDSSFGIGGKAIFLFSNVVDAYPGDIKIQEDGKILLGGTAYLPGAQGDFQLIRCKQNGVLDSSFGTSGQVITDLGTNTDEIYSLDIQTDGKILAAGSCNGYIGIARYYADGRLDTSFGNNGIITSGFACFSIKSLFDGKYITVGFGQTGDFGIKKYLNNGTLDSSFGLNGESDIIFFNQGGSAEDIAVLQNGELLVSGYAINSQNQTQIVTAKLKSNGSLDSSFGLNGKSFPSFGLSYTANSILLQNDGKIILSALPISSGNYIVARLFSDGSIDSSFGKNGISALSFGASDSYRALNFCALQNDGKIVIVGGGTSYIARVIGDDPITVNIKKNISVVEGNTGSTLTGFKIVLNRASEYDVRVNYNTIDGTAAAGSDYIGVNGFTIIKAGKTSRNIVINVIGDTIEEANEKFSFILYNPINAVIGIKDTAICTIKNDDLEPIAALADNESDVIVNTNFKVYPNPVTSVLHVNGISETDKVIATIIDMNGNTIQKFNLSNDKCNLDVKYLTPGIYMLMVEFGNKRQLIKIVKE